MILNVREKKRQQEKKKAQKEAAEALLFPTAHPERQSTLDSHGGRKSAAWLISFTDVIALMLTFFVLLFAMSEPEREKWTSITTALQTEIGKFYGAQQGKGEQTGLNIDRLTARNALDLQYLQGILQGIITTDDALGAAWVIRTDETLVMSLPSDFLFDSGSADLGPNGRHAIERLVTTLSSIKNAVEIHGHTDPNPLNGSGRFRSNWQLSLARAASVAAFLYEEGYDKTIPIQGLADSRLAYLTAVSDQNELFRLNRRVDIVIHQRERHRRQSF